MKNEVIFNTQDIFVLDHKQMAYLIDCTRMNKRKTARICIHKNIDENLQQMIIVHHRGNYVRPHRHPAKTESFHLIQGRLLLVIFDANGHILDRILLGDDGEQTPLVARLEKNIYHSMVPLTEVVVFHEICNGPFTGTGDSEFPDWAPGPDDQEGVQRFLARLEG